MSRARLRENSSTSTLPIFIGSWDGARKRRSSLLANYLAQEPANATLCADIVTGEMACASQPRKASLWAARGDPVSGPRPAARRLQSLFRHITTLFYDLG